MEQVFAVMQVFFRKGIYTGGWCLLFCIVSKGITIIIRLFIIGMMDSLDDLFFSSYFLLASIYKRNTDSKPYQRQYHEDTGKSLAPGMCSFSGHAVQNTS